MRSSNSQKGSIARYAWSHDAIDECVRPPAGGLQTQRVAGLPRIAVEMGVTDG
jgi:hypothetical protein